MSNNETIYDFELGLAAWAKENPKHPVGQHIKLTGTNGNFLGHGVVLRIKWQRAWNEYYHDILLDDGTIFTNVGEFYLSRITRNQKFRRVK